MSEIPVNTRVIGDPKGEEILYFEDYVYTFMKRILEECRRQDCEVMFYGKRTYRNGAEVYIISGAIHVQKDQIEQNYFATNTFLGRGWIERGVESDICVNFVTQDKKKIQKKDFYIYYAQNEEMQNYMVGWNQEHHGVKNRVENQDSVRYTRMVQNYNREEVKIGFLWNVMNILGLSFIICVMVYAIISMNQYYKLKDMEENLAYVISVMSNSEYVQAVNADEFVRKEILAEEELQQENVAEEDDSKTMAIEAENSQEELASVDLVQDENVELVIKEETQVAAESLIVENGQTYVQVLDEQESQQIIENSVGQDKKVTQMSEQRQYIVQDGDTLRSIAYAHYGSYDMVDLICLENKITDPNNILSGQKLLLP